MKRKIAFILSSLISFSYVSIAYACPEGQHSYCEYDEKGVSVCICIESKKEN